MASEPRSWQLPWLRIELILLAMLAEHWSADAWQQIRPEIPTALAEKGRIERMGWFN